MSICTPIEIQFTIIYHPAPVVTSALDFLFRLRFLIDSPPSALPSGASSTDSSLGERLRFVPASTSFVYEFGFGLVFVDSESFFEGGSTFAVFFFTLRGFGPLGPFLILRGCSTDADAEDCTNSSPGA